MGSLQKLALISIPSLLMAYRPGHVDTSNTDRYTQDTHKEKQRKKRHVSCMYLHVFACIWQYMHVSFHIRLQEWLVGKLLYRQY